MVPVGVVPHGLFGAVTEHGLDRCDHLIASHTAGFGQLVRSGAGGCVYDRLAALRVGVEPLGQDAAGAGGAIRPREVARIDDIAELLAHEPSGLALRNLPTHLLGRALGGDAQVAHRVSVTADYRVAESYGGPFAVGGRRPARRRAFEGVAVAVEDCLDYGGMVRRHHPVTLTVPQSDRLGGGVGILVGDAVRARTHQPRPASDQHRWAVRPGRYRVVVVGSCVLAGILPLCDPAVWVPKIVSWLVRRHVCIR